MGITPGHVDASGRSYRTLDPAATALRCFRCHSTGTLKLNRGSLEIEPAEQGVQCESCHGPGATHVQLAGASGTILNPRNLSAVELNSFCGSCHRKAEDVADWSNSWNVRHEPAYLNQSACFRMSKGSLSCLTCHDAHTPLSRVAASYDRRCFSCHTRVQHRAPVAGVACVTCHMPQVRSSAELQFTNHWIGVYAKGSPLVPVRATASAAPAATNLKIVPPADPSSLRPIFEETLAGALKDPNAVTARRASDLGLFLRSIGDLEGASRYLAQALAIDQVRNNPEVAQDREDLASVLLAQKRHQEAERLFREAAEGSNPAVSARSWAMLASLEPANAVSYYAKALDAQERASGSGHPNVAVVLNNYALALRRGNNSAAAEPLLRRALAIQRKVLPPSHPAIASTLNNLGSLLQSAQRPEEAERLEREGLRILLQQLGPQTAELATAYTNLADLLWTRGARAEASGFYRKALAIDEFEYGIDDPEVAGDLTNLGLLLREMGQQAEAEKLLRRAATIFEKKMGPNSAEAIQARSNLDPAKR